MQYNDRRIGQTTLENWTLEFYETTGPAGYLCSSVEIFNSDRRKARLTLVRPGLAASEVVEQLVHRAEQWIVEYEARDGNASTGFSEL